MRLGKLLIPLLMVVSSVVFSQQTNSTRAVEGDYIVIDLSKSLEGNKVHDRLYYLILNSHSVDLPSEITDFLDAIPDEPNLHHKLTLEREEILKVLYNNRIHPDDKKFICNHYLQDRSYEPLIPIMPYLEAYVRTGSVK